MRPDITVYGPGERPILSAEVLTGIDPPDQDWAAKFREQLAQQGMDHATSYFLMVVPEKGFLWKGATALDARPDFIFDTKLFLQPFLGERDIRRVSAPALIMAVSGWLDDLATSLDTAACDKESYGWLINSGLYDLLKKSSSSILIESRT